mmetsp:Transcript_26049/g.84238  ORF Transcript_26049/g.84238 Transcript_26049/m.84238 type:complete len:206 (+) Transcript_26049:334-951(+)
MSTVSRSARSASDANSSKMPRNRSRPRMKWPSPRAAQNAWRSAFGVSCAAADTTARSDRSRWLANWSASPAPSTARRTTSKSSRSAALANSSARPSLSTAATTRRRVPRSASVHRARARPRRWSRRMTSWCLPRRVRATATPAASSASRAATSDARFGTTTAPSVVALPPASNSRCTPSVRSGAVIVRRGRLRWGRRNSPRRPCR